MINMKTFKVKNKHKSAGVQAGLNAKAKFHYRSLSYALYRCRLSFTLLWPLPSKGGCATTLCTDLPSATFSIWHFYNQCLFNSFRQVIWLECESKVSLIRVDMLDSFAEVLNLHH